MTTEPHRSVAYRTFEQNQWFDPRLGKFIPRIDYYHSLGIHSSLTAVHCFDNSYVGKQPVAWKKYCAEYWLEELRETMMGCPDRRDITEILLKMELSSMQSINQS